jgi:hypothetical protein
MPKSRIFVPHLEQPGRLIESECGVAVISRHRTLLSVSRRQERDAFDDRKAPIYDENVRPYRAEVEQQQETYARKWLEKCRIYEK